MKNKLQRIAPDWHAEAKKLLADNFAKIHSQFLDSTKKAVWLGIFLNQIKLRGKEDGSIPHGEFGPWFEKNMPDVSYRQAQTFMLLARGVCEKGNFQIRDFRAFAASGELPPQLLKLVEGKTQGQLLLDFKQTEEGADGELHVKKGRLKGQGGATKEQREKAKFADEAELVQALRERADEFSDWLMEYANDKAFGLPAFLQSAENKKFQEALKYATGFFRHQT
jgi:hypothetical protein